MRSFLLGWTHDGEGGYSEVSATDPLDAFRTLRHLLSRFGSGLRITQIMETTGS